MRRVYSLLLLLAMPLILLRLLWRGFRQREYWRNWDERFAKYAQFPLPCLHDAIWLHAVSVGEMRATLPLVQRLRTQYPQRPILLSCMTPTGRDTARTLYGDDVTCVYLPYDFFRWQSRLIAHFKPSILLIMETEIWPNLLAACKSQNVPTFLVNARMSEKSQHGYARFELLRALTREALQSLHAVAAQSTLDRERLETLGARNIIVTGNLKFDLSIDPAMIKRGERLRRSLPQEERVLLAASTREGEEALLVDAYKKYFSATDRANTLLVIVPRHPQRFDQVYSLIQRLGLKVSRRSMGETIAEEIEVWLGDSMGEMAAYVALCDVAFIGGSLLPLGGQNLIEAAAQGKPVIMGPSVFNFAEAARLAIDAGAMYQVDDANGVMQTAIALLRDDEKRNSLSRAALTFAQAHEGATEKTMGLIAPLLSAIS